MVKSNQESNFPNFPMIQKPTTIRGGGCSAVVKLLLTTSYYIPIERGHWNFWLTRQHSQGQDTNIMAARIFWDCIEFFLWKYLSMQRQEIREKRVAKAEKTWCRKKGFSNQGHWWPGCLMEAWLKAGWLMVRASKGWVSLQPGCLIVKTKRTRIF